MSARDDPKGVDPFFQKFYLLSVGFHVIIPYMETPRRTKTDRTALRRAILENLSKPEKKKLSWRELADEHKVGVETVYQQINKMRVKGILPDSEPKQAPKPEVVTQEADALWEKVQRGEFASPEDRRQALSVILASGSDQNKIAASRELTAMDAAETRGIGPIIPMTDEEKRDRLVRLMKLVGKKVTIAAMEVAFGITQEQNSPEADQDRPTAVQGESQQDASGGSNLG